MRGLYGFVKMPVAGRYVAMELAKKENRKSLYKIVDKDKRRTWVTQRMKSIVRDIRQLETAIRSAGKDKLFGENSFPKRKNLLELLQLQQTLSLRHSLIFAIDVLLSPLRIMGNPSAKPLISGVKSSVPIRNFTLCYIALKYTVILRIIWR